MLWNLEQVNNFRTRNKNTDHDSGDLDHIQDQHYPIYQRQPSNSGINSFETVTIKSYEPIKPTINPAIYSEAKHWDEPTSSEMKQEPSSSHMDLNRRESIASTSKSISEWNWAESRSSDEKVSPGACSVNSGIFKVVIERSTVNNYKN